MSELPDEVPPGVEPEPVESSAGIVVRRVDDGGWQVLLGLRSRRSRFMPGHLAFPGGRLEDADRPGEPGAHARCVAREMAEETGLRIDEANWLAAGVRVTPPMFPLRFRTEFFVAQLRAGGAASLAPASAEVEELHIVEAARTVEEWSAGRWRIPPPALPVLRALAAAPASPLAELAGRIAAVNEQEQRAPRIEFSPEVWVLPVRTRTLPPATHTNVWMPGGRRFVLIDPGSAEEAENERLLQVVERRRALGDEPLAILLTHHHRDHVAGARRVAAALGVPLRAHRQTLGALPDSVVAGVHSEPLADGDVVDLDGLALRAIHTPGHAPGHLAFALVDRQALIAGDLISGLSTILIDPESGDMTAYMASLKAMHTLGCRTLLPAHGPPLPAQALDRLIRHRRDREQRILAQLHASEVALTAIAGEAYKDVPDAPPILTARQTLAHLQHLERQGRARRVDAEGRVWTGA